jgi:hypothetical protein
MGITAAQRALWGGGRGHGPRTTAPPSGSDCFSILWASSPLGNGQTPLGGGPDFPLPPCCSSSQLPIAGCWHLRIVSIRSGTVLITTALQSAVYPSPSPSTFSSSFSSTTPRAATSPTTAPGPASAAARYRATVPGYFLSSAVHNLLPYVM